MNYTALFIQLLPEAVLVITALVLLGVAVATEAKSKRPISVDLAIAISALGIAAAGFALYRCPFIRTAISVPSLAFIAGFETIKS